MTSAYPAPLAPHFPELAAKWNAIPDQYQGNARAMLSLLENVRHVGGGRPLTVNSWYRTPAHNAAVGGTGSSQHLTASAVDVSVVNPAMWADRVRTSGVPFGQLIYYRATSGHVHISLPNRASGRTGEYLIESKPGVFDTIVPGVPGTVAGLGVMETVDRETGESLAGLLVKWSLWAVAVAAVLAILGVF